MIIIFLQIIIGAFVSGLDAGMIYQTWPLMGNSFLPNDLNLLEFYNFFELESHSLVQFYHRNIAYFIVLYSLFLTILIYKKKNKTLYKPLFFLLTILIIQVVLGITTLISGLNTSAHNCESLSALNLYYLNAKQIDFI